MRTSVSHTESGACLEAFSWWSFTFVCYKAQIFTTLYLEKQSVKVHCSKYGRNSFKSKTVLNTHCAKLYGLLNRENLRSVKDVFGWEFGNLPSRFIGRRVWVLHCTLQEHPMAFGERWFPLCKSRKRLCAETTWKYEYIFVAVSELHAMP